MSKFAVIFKTVRDLPVPEEYMKINNELQDLVAKADGFLGVQSVGDDKGRGLSISYWESLESVKSWKQQALHLEAQKLGAQKFYKYYQVQVCEVHEEYEGGTDADCFRGHM